jgi:hypothetical protein
MTNFRSGLALLILLVALLLAWLAISVMVSSSLAWIMGFLLLVFWFLVFAPITLIKEALWRARQGALIRKIRAQEERMQAMGGGSSGNALMLRPESANLPQTMLVEQHELMSQFDDTPFHREAFKRSLVLVVAGVLMMVGASSDSLQDAILTFAENQSQARVAWAEFDAGQNGDMLAMKAAARLTLEREPSCAAILDGKVEAQNQLSSDTPSEDEQPIYVFTCKPITGDTFSAWVNMALPSRTGFASLRGFFRKAATPEAVQKTCTAGLKALIEQNKATLTESPTHGNQPLFMPANRPYADYARLIFTASVVRAGTPMSVHANCWSNGQLGVEYTTVRLFKK